MQNCFQESSVRILSVKMVGVKIHEDIIGCCLSNKLVSMKWWVEAFSSAVILVVFYYKQEDQQSMDIKQLIENSK